MQTPDAPLTASPPLQRVAGKRDVSHAVSARWYALVARKRQPASRQWLRPLCMSFFRILTGGWKYQAPIAL